VAVALVAACGGRPPASVDAFKPWPKMTALDAVSNTTDGLIVITNSEDACADLAADRQPANLQKIVIRVGTRTGGLLSAPQLPGTYAVVQSVPYAAGNGNMALVEYGATDADCVANDRIIAGVGTVTLTELSPEGYSGTFDVRAGYAEVTGSFTARHCSALTMKQPSRCR
jgi:hypothetical protein